MGGEKYKRELPMFRRDLWTTYEAGTIPKRDTYIGYLFLAAVAERETVLSPLTRPRFKVISTTKWELAITRKYRVASSAMVLRIVGTLSPRVPDFAAKKMIDSKARESG